jgi:hypothetical protein
MRAASWGYDGQRFSGRLPSKDFFLVSCWRFEKVDLSLNLLIEVR